MKKRLITLIFVSSAGFASAASIAMNFSENNGNQSWLAPDTPIGPLGILSGNFNSNNNPNANGTTNVLTGNLATGTASNLVDSNGNGVSTTVEWSSNNAWYNGSGIATDEARLSVGYLDDGGAGARVTISDIPYATYNVYVLLGSDAGNEHNSEIPLVNEVPVLSADFPAFGNLVGSGGGWIEADGTTRGNYVVARGLTGSTATIAGQNSTGNRIGISGFIIEEQQQIPEPSSTLLALSATALLIRRRR